MSHVLYDLAAFPEYIEPLREEVETITAVDGWTKAAMGKMRKLDSFLKESMRLADGSLSASAPSLSGSPSPPSPLTLYPARTVNLFRKAVKDVTFSNDGRRFLSCGYDRQMKLWDTETGQCLKRFSNGKIPYVVRFHPDEDKQHIFLAGMSDKKIIQVRPPAGYSAVLRADVR